LPSTWIDSTRLALLFCVLMVSGLTYAQSPGYLEAGMFSSARAGESLPPGWQSLTFSRIERHTDDYPARIYITFAFDPDMAGYLERLEHEAARLIRGKDVPYRAISYI